jgi:hypothetical protein
VHNDYLEQASDSWVGGLLAYALFIVAGVAWSFPKRGRVLAAGCDDWQVFSVWLWVLGWSLQSLVEFGLYIPALAWPAFAFLGWLLGRNRSKVAPEPRLQSPITDPDYQPLRKPIDKPPSRR